MAESRGVAGSVRNRADGAVEAVFEGEPGSVDALVAFMHQGPERAEVTSVEVAQEDPEGLEGFTIV